MDAVERVKRLGLDALEVEFVRGVRMRETNARDLGRRARELDVSLTAHAPYYINLNSDDQEKRERSVDRIVATGNAASAMGAWLIVVHAATYMGRDPSLATRAVIEGLSLAREALDECGGRRVTIGLETMGKRAVWGTLDEIAEVMTEVSGVMPVLDVAHVHARYGGILRTRADFDDLIIEYGSMVGRAHLHMSGIEFGGRGEMRHLPLGDPDPIIFMDAIRSSFVDATVIVETPDPSAGALLLKDLLQISNSGRDI